GSRAANGRVTDHPRACQEGQRPVSLTRIPAVEVRPEVGPLFDWMERLQAKGYARRQSLVLLNGLCEQPESWFRNVGFWRRHFEVFMPNLLRYDGDLLHARIDAGEPVSVDYLVDQLHHYLDTYVQAPPYHLVAASLGGKIAVEYAARYPQR